MKIYAALPSGAAGHGDLLRQLTQGDEVWVADPQAMTASDFDAFAEAEVAFGLIPIERLETARRLRWIQFVSVGIEAYRDVVWDEFPSITCTNLGGLYAEPMAQTVLAGLLGLYRGIDQLAQAKPQREWQKERLHARIEILQEAHVLLLGNGNVNRRVRALLQPFGCRFTVFARTRGDIRTPAELDAVLSGIDVVCAALPDTPQTRGLLDASRLARLKAGAIVVNVGRGSLIDEAALIERLTAGHLGGAVLDVTQREPLPEDDPLWNSPRTILTQHTSAGSRHVMVSALAFFATNLEAYRSGRSLMNVVDWARGY
ncbi:MAG TPA: D-2-hydroxyacid dehydrogenase [Opitutus sp.]|nr:D-2-hydroxyacid dehydrogenase [Opitutus sp.]